MLYEYGGELKKKPCFRDLEHWFHLIQWHKIRDSSDYMMPYMFPIHLPTFRTEESFVIAPEVVGMLRDDADWSEGYARCVEILLAAWGYDLLQSRTTWRAESVGLLDTSVLDRRSLRGFHPGGGGRHQYSPDSWKLRHLLLSLRTFKIGVYFRARFFFLTELIDAEKNDHLHPCCKSTTCSFEPLLISVLRPSSLMCRRCTRSSARSGRTCCETGCC